MQLEGINEILSKLLIHEFDEPVCVNVRFLTRYFIPFVPINHIVQCVLYLLCRIVIS